MFSPSSGKIRNTLRGETPRQFGFHSVCVAVSLSILFVYLGAMPLLRGLLSDATIKALLFSLGTTSLVSILFFISAELSALLTAETLGCRCAELFALLEQTQHEALLKLSHIDSSMLDNYGILSTHSLKCLAAAKRISRAVSARLDLAKGIKGNRKRHALLNRMMVVDDTISEAVIDAYAISPLKPHEIPAELHKLIDGVIEELESKLSGNRKRYAMQH